VSEAESGRDAVRRISHIRLALRVWGKGGEETPHALAFRGGCTVCVLYILYVLVSTDKRFLFLDNLSFVCIKNYPYEQNGRMSTVWTPVPYRMAQKVITLRYGSQSVDTSNGRILYGRMPIRYGAQP
jgi:hypothetical protein